MPSDVPSSDEQHQRQLQQQQQRQPSRLEPDGNISNNTAVNVNRPRLSSPSPGRASPGLDASRPTTAASSTTTIRTTASTASPSSISNARRHISVHELAASAHESSREAGEMHCASTPPDAAGGRAVKYTRTGRVSKATKGQPVHHCDECGKTYTRAEHLRRHQQNHKPGAFPCDVSDCGRSFHREDLLARHRARHNESPSRRQSIGSHFSTPDLGPRSDQPPTTATAPSVLPPLPANIPPQQSSSGMSHVHRSSNDSSSTKPGPVNRYIRLDELRDPISVGLIGINGTANSYPVSFPNSPPPSSPPYHDSDSPPHDYYREPPYYPPNLIPARDLAELNYNNGYYAPSCSRSPASVVSTGVMPQWGSCATSTAAALYNATMATTHPAHDMSLHYAPNYIPRVCDSSLGVNAEMRDFMEVDDLAMPGTGLNISMDGQSIETLDRYASAYWAEVHPLFPIIHRPTFLLPECSPLLRAAILALGGQALRDRTDVTHARLLHEKCVKVLRKRTDRVTHTDRVCDLQAIVLIEIYSIFKSRRPPLEFSRSFELAYRRLASDPQLLAPDVVPDGTGYGGCSQGFPPGSDLRCKQRLLICCHLLDVQHATLFGRKSSGILPPGFSEFTLPTSQTAWDNNAFEQYAEPVDEHSPALGDNLYTVTKQMQYLLSPLQPRYDAFQSSLIIAAISNQAEDLQAIGAVSDDEETAHPPMLWALEDSARSQLAYHTFMLCKHAPVRDLLAVAGESWVMSEKLPLQSDYTSAQFLVREWASGAALNNACHGGLALRSALSHAFAILKVYQANPRCGGLLFQDWAVHLAAITIWSRVYTITAEDRRPPLDMPGSASSRHSPEELDHAVARLLVEGPGAAHTWADSQRILLWAQEKLLRVDVPHNCGLVSGALDVLGKIIARGGEPNWF